jgi:Phosphatidylinositol N-acetylglucosaminyltransferase
MPVRLGLVVLRRHEAEIMPQTPCLWLDSGLPDNHVGEHFLNSLVLKREAAWSYWHVVVSASAITSQMSIVGMVSAITGHLYQVGMEYLQVSVLMKFMLQWRNASMLAHISVAGHA